MARQKSEREAIRRRQTQLQPNSPISIHPSRSQPQLQRLSLNSVHSNSSSRVSSPRVNLFRRSEDEQQERSSSAPETKASSLNGYRAPESAEDVSEWVQSRQELPTAELEDTAVRQI